MNSKDEAIALELTKIYADDRTLGEDRIYEVFNGYLTKLRDRKKIETSHDELQTKLGNYIVAFDKLKSKMSDERNFIYKDELRDILGGLDD